MLKLIQKLQNFIRKITMARQLVRETCQSIYSDPNGVKILFINSKFDPFHSLFCYFMGAQLARQNFIVEILCDDAQLSHYDNENHASLKSFFLRRSSLIWYFRNFVKTKLFLTFSGMKNQSGLRFIYYSEILNGHLPRVSEQSDVWKSILSGHPLPPQVEASHRRYFGGRPFDLKNLYHQFFARLTLENFLINEAIAKKLMGQYKLVLCLDGTYTTPGALYNALTSHPKTKGLVYQHDGFKDRSLYIGKFPAAIATRTDEWKNFQQTHKEFPKLGYEFLEKRTSAAHQIFSVQEEAVLAKIQAKKEKLGAKKVISLFPNLTWDCAIAERNTIFKSMDHWITTTIEIAQKENYLVILREHPQSQADYNPKDSVASLLKEVYPKLFNSQNLFIIDGLTEFSSYKLAKQISDLNLIYNGTLAIELAFLELPVVICARSPYSNLGLGLEPASIEEFRQIIYQDHPYRMVEKNIACTFAEFHFLNNSFFCPLMPLTKNAFGDESKFWINWDYSTQEAKFKLNRTIDRILLELTTEKEVVL